LFESCRLQSAGCGKDKALAFTRVELLVVIGTLALLALLAVPVLANGKSTSQRAVCAGNLARVGRALAIWGAERGDLYPWQVDARDGGTRNHPSGLNDNIWFQFSWVSNELVTPKILACPSDRFVKIPQSFAFAPDGFLDPHYLNNAVSYFLGHPFFEDGRLILGGDRSMSGGSFGSSACPYFGTGVFGLVNPAMLEWLGIMHVNSGNLLFNDGSVEQTDTDGLRKAMNGYYPLDSTGRSSLPHFQFPRPPYPLENDN
jgi:type II secretory pathway pseudopilin PulG